MQHRQPGEVTDCGDVRGLELPLVHDFAVEGNGLVCVSHHVAEPRLLVGSDLSRVRPLGRLEKPRQLLELGAVLQFVDLAPVSGDESALNGERQAPVDQMPEVPPRQRRVPLAEPHSSEPLFSGRVRAAPWRKTNAAQSNVQERGLSAQKAANGARGTHFCPFGRGGGTEAPFGSGGVRPAADEHEVLTHETPEPGGQPVEDRHSVPASAEEMAGYRQDLHLAELERERFSDGVG